MVNPDSEARLFSALQRNEGTEEEKQRRQKIINDLKQGFRITRAAPDTDYVHVVTRYGNDFFEVTLGIDHLIATPHNLTSDLETFLYCEVGIRRTKEVESERITLDSWDAHVSTPIPLTQTFSPGREITEEEFWERYNASTVDPVATRRLSELLTSQPFGTGFQMTWISEELPK